jgi:predicted nucleic acid-binding protein
MRALLDANVVIDFIKRREPWYTEAAAFWQAAKDGSVEGFVAAISVTNIFYIIRRSNGLEDARRTVGQCLASFGICPVDRAILEAADLLLGKDYEDNVQIACATATGCDVIVTRDTTGFRDSPVPALAPADALARFT